MASSKKLEELYNMASKDLDVHQYMLSLQTHHAILDQQRATGKTTTGKGELLKVLPLFGIEVGNS